MRDQVAQEGRAVLKGGKGGGLFKGVFFTLVFTLLADGILLLAASLVFHFLPNASAYIGTVGCAVGVLSSFFGGLLSGKRQKHTATLAGTLYGLLYLLTVILIGQSLGGGAPLIKRIVGYGILLLLSLIGGAIGGVEIGGHRRKRRHR